MSADKFLKLQTDVRHNQQDLQSYLRDLKSWESSIKKTDHQLTQGDSAPDEKKLPPIRHKKADGAKKRRKKKPASGPEVSEESEDQKAEGVNTSTKEGKKIRAYDYRSWDKFDVDAACAAVDSDDERSNLKAADVEEEEEEEEEETDSEAEREEMEEQRRIMEANAEKEKGNTFFKKGRYEEAVACYSKGLEADPNNALLSANRAMAFLKLKRYEEAEKDCDEAIGLDYTYVKAFARRGSARLELGKLEEAKKDFEQVLNIETDNKQAKNEIRKIDGILRQREEARRKANEPSNLVHAIDKPPHLRSKKPLKRMVIQEIGKGVAEEKQRKREQLMAQAKTDTVQRNNDDSQRRVTTAETVAEKQQQRIQEVKSRTDANDPGNKENVKNSATQKDKGASNQRSRSAAEKTKAPSLSASKPALPGIPSSSVQLQADWKRLKGHPDMLFDYFKKIAPASYEKLFQNSLDSAMLNQILNLLKDSYIPSNTPMFETLERLSSVKRFTMIIMFMSSREKQVVKDIFAHLTSESNDEQRCQELAKKYGL